VNFEFENELWRWERRSALYTFISLTEDVEEEVLEVAGGLLNGWGSVRVDATIGITVFRTSVFPSSDTGRYMLPVKKSVCAAERIAVGDTVTVLMSLVDF
jgi:hypothetical protein